MLHAPTRTCYESIVLFFTFYTTADKSKSDVVLVHVLPAFIAGASRHCDCTESISVLIFLYYNFSPPLFALN